MAFRRLLPTLVVPVVIAVLLTAVACAAAGETALAPEVEHENHALQVLIDTDMGLDDVRALFALLAVPWLDVEGIVVTEGAASLGRGMDNLIGLVESLHRDGVPLLLGRRSFDATIPPWRGIADRLGGALFPPPRRIRPLCDLSALIESISGEHDDELGYVVLGPLSTLAALKTENPQAFKGLEAVWMPARLAEDHVLCGWNLEYDRASAMQVLATAPRIVVVDLPPATAIDAARFLSELHGIGAGARWVGRLLAELDSSRSHLMIYDELVAAALIAPELLDVEKQRWRAARLDAAGIVLEASPAGNIEIARFRDLDAALSRLAGLWCDPAASGIDHSDHSHSSDEPPLAPERLLKAFHGHLGPYVVLGYRLSRLAVETAGCEGHFDIEATVYTPLTPPPSCIIDGIQIGSGCTLGKRNIEVLPCEGPARALFTAKNGRRLVVGLKPGVPGRVKELVESLGVEEAGMFFLTAPKETLFEVHELGPVKLERRVF